MLLTVGAGCSSVKAELGSRDLEKGVPPETSRLVGGKISDAFRPWGWGGEG